MTKKQPKAGASTTVGKKPASPELKRIGQDKVAWQFARMELDGPWAWAVINKDELLGARNKLSGVEQLTWSEAMQGHTPSLKRIPKAHLSNEAQKRLQGLMLDDVDELYELRLSGKTRIWPREEPSFLLLWWDPLHKVCPSQKKHT